MPRKSIYPTTQEYAKIIEERERKEFVEDLKKTTICADKGDCLL